MVRGLCGDRIVVLEFVDFGAKKIVIKLLAIEKNSCVKKENDELA